jgi:hypothetical protein
LFGGGEALTLDYREREREREREHEQ